MLLKENLNMAIKSILSNKMRSFLTMLGIIIGISSVIVIVATGSGAERYMMSQFEQVGNSTVQITLNSKKATDQDRFSFEDIKAIKDRVPHVKAVSPSIHYYGTAGSGENAEDAVAIGGTDDMLLFNNVKMITGRFYNEDEYYSGKKVAVIDQRMAELAFGNTDVVGMRLDVYVRKHRISLKIIGVAKNEMGDFDIPDMPGYVYMPATTLTEAINAKSDFDLIYVMADDSTKTEAVGNSAVNLLEARHSSRGREIYRAENLMKQVEMISNILGIIQTFIAAVAGISLVVGGIGVMNIMLVVVTERTREIGIRKSLGAKTKAIMLQFLTESAIPTLIGGTIGLLFGIVGATGLCSIAKIEPVFTASSIIGTLIFSASVGIFFGMYPAKKAAQLRPIEALRHQ